MTPHLNAIFARTIKMSDIFQTIHSLLRRKKRQTTVTKLYWSCRKTLAQLYSLYQTVTTLAVFKLPSSCHKVFWKVNSLGQTRVADKGRECFILWITLLDLSSTFSLLEYPSLVPDIPSAVCGRSLVLLPKDISAQIGQNKVQIWHIMARGDLQRASFERKWEFSTFGFDTDVILRIPLQIIKKTCLSKENPYPKYLLNMLCLFVRRYCLTFLHSEQCARRCRCCSLWNTKGLNSEHTQHANVKVSFWFQTISHRNNMSHRNCPFINNDNLPLPRAFFHTIVFCNRWCGMRQASGYLASVPSQSWGCSPLHC